MTVRKTTKKRTIKSRKRPNPEWWDKLVGSKKSTLEPGAYPFAVTDGVIILKGEKVASSLSEIDTLFSSRLKNLQIEFEPYNTGKRYILNKAKGSPEAELEDDETTTEGRFERMRRQSAMRSGRLGKK
jgi:hypothetical protein